jgi:hypothetical protein
MSAPASPKEPFVRDPDIDDELDAELRAGLDEIERGDTGDYVEMSVVLAELDAIVEEKRKASA